MPTYEIIADTPLSEIEMMLALHADEDDKALFLLMARRLRDTHTKQPAKIKDVEGLGVNTYMELLNQLASVLREKLIPEYRQIQYLRRFKLERGQKPS
jgi:hypothetical protein